jgi:peptide/nickel transport system substrate-binding protein
MDDTDMKNYFSSSLVRLIAVFLAAVPILSAPVRAEQDRAYTVVFELATPLSVPGNFNWYQSQSRRDAGAHQAMWEPLFILDYATGKLEPWLGLSITPNPEQTVWTLKLRSGVTWSDGKPFTAKDVKFTAQMVIDHLEALPAYEAATFARNFDSSAQISAPDALTVIFTLRAPNPRFALENFGAGFYSSFLIMPEHLWRDAASSDEGLARFEFTSPIGTGPYVLDTVSPDAVSWKRNDNWWGAKANPPFRSLPEPLALEWRYFGSETDSINALIDNDLDAPVAYSPEAFAHATTNIEGLPRPGIVTWGAIGLPAWNEPCPRQLEINTEQGPWTDLRLRKALSLMIDRAALAQAVHGTAALPSTTMFPDYGAMKPFIDAIVTAGHGASPHSDLSAATAELEKAGYLKVNGFFEKDGQVLEAEITVNGDVATDLTAAVALRDQLIAAGLQARVKDLTDDEYWGVAIPKGHYELAYGWLACGSVAEPFTSMNRYTEDKYAKIGDRSPGFGNTGRWHDDAAKQYSDIVKDIGKAPVDDPQVPDFVAKAYAFVADDVPFIPLIQSPKLFVFNTVHWSGWPTAAECEPLPPPLSDTPPPSTDAPVTCTVPMHEWSATERLLFQLKKSAP